MSLRAIANMPHDTLVNLVSISTARALEISSARGAALGEEILDVSVAERETQVDPHGMLDDNRRKAVTTVGELHHPVSLLAPLSPACDYPDKAASVVQRVPNRVNFVVARRLVHKHVNQLISDKSHCF